MTINKAAVVGGSSGIGLAVCCALVKRGCKVKVLGLHKPEGINCEYEYCDMRYPDIMQFESLAHDDSINALFISSGIGRFADFQHFSIPEIEKTLTIDTVSVLKLLRVFYDKLLMGGGA